MAYFNHGLAGIWSSFVILAVATTTTVPCVTALYNPTYANRTKAFAALRWLLHFDRPIGALSLHPSIQALVIIFVVTEDDLHAWEIIDAHTLDYEWCCGTVVSIGSSDHNCDEKPKHVDQQMSLSTLDFLASIVAPFVSTDLGCFRRLAVDACYAVYSRSSHHLWVDEASTREPSPAIIDLRSYEMTIESFIDTLNTEQQQVAFDLLWQRLSADPRSLPSPTWHGEVLVYRSENPSSSPKMTVSEAKIEVKRMVDERRNSR